MALQTIQQRLLDKIGEALSGNLGITALMIKDWINMGLRVIIGRLPKNVAKITLNTKPTTFVPNTGFVLESAKLIDVHRTDSDSVDRECTMVSHEDISSVQDINSRFYPSEFLPKYILVPQTDATRKVMIYPGSADSIGKATRVTYPETDPATDITIAGFPDELEPALDLYGLIQAKIREAALERTNAVTALPTFTEPDKPTLPTVTLEDMTTLPTYTSPTFTFSTTVIDDALEKAQFLIDNLGSTDFESYITDDDSEMARVTVEGAAQEVRRAGAAIQNEVAQIQDFKAQFEETLGEYRSLVEAYIGEYTGKNTALIQAFSADATAEINRYAQEVQGELAQFSQNITKSSTYLTQSRLAMEEIIVLQKNFDTQIELFIRSFDVGQSKK